MPDDLINDIVDKTFSDKIPDISFELFARLIPGIFTELYYFYLFNPRQLSEIQKSWTTFMIIAYLIGHLIQPFSSGILQRKFSFLANKKSPIVVKAYSELVGFFSSLIAILLLTIFYTLGRINIIEFPEYETVNIVVVFVVIVYFIISTVLRFRAVQRKMGSISLISDVPIQQVPLATEAKSEKQPSLFRVRIRSLFNQLKRTSQLFKKKFK